jgi:hypothetical protein
MALCSVRNVEKEHWKSNAVSSIGISARALESESGELACFGSDDCCFIVLYSLLYTINIHINSSY